MTAGTTVSESVLDSRSSGGTDCGTFISNSCLVSATMMSMLRARQAASKSCAAAASSTVATTRPSFSSAPAPLPSGDSSTAQGCSASSSATNSE
jgi:hypothetical protein